MPRLPTRLRLREWLAVLALVLAALLATVLVICLLPPVPAPESTPYR